MPSLTVLHRHQRNRMPGIVRQRNATASMPPEYKADPKLVRKLRYTFINTSLTSSVALTITRKTLMGTYAFLSSTTLATSAYSSVQIQRVQVWNCPTPVGGSGAPQANISFVTLGWESENAPLIELSSAGNLVNLGYITSTPPAGSLAGFWTSASNADTQPLFNLQIPPTSQIFVDVHIQYVPCAAGDEFTFVPQAGSGTNHFSYQPLDQNGGLTPVSNIS